MALSLFPTPQRAVALTALWFSMALSMASAFANTASNGILTLFYDDIGRLSLETGTAHPVPGATVFYPVGTSYISVRDDGRRLIYVNDDVVSGATIAGDTVVQMGAGTMQKLGTLGFRTTWRCPISTSFKRWKSPAPPCPTPTCAMR